ncbi:MAG: hypothetical protein AB7R90_04170 [Reyranellaceae bacterium]
MRGRSRFRARNRAWSRVFVGGGGSQYDADFQAYVTATGLNDPSYLAALNQFVLDLKSYSLWSKFDRLWVLANADSTAALTCLKSLTTATAMHSPIFTAGEGFTFNGLTQYLKSNFARNSGSQYSRDSASFGAFIRSGTISGVHSPISASNPSKTNVSYFLLGFPASDSFYGAINSTDILTVTTATGGPIGLWHVTRTAASGTGAVAVYKHGLLKGAGTTTSVDVDTEEFAIGAVGGSGGIGSVWNGQISLAMIGAGFNAAEAADFNTAVAALGAAIGFSPSLDPDAIAYFSRASVTDNTVRTATNQLVLDMKAASIWYAYDVLILHANQDAIAGCFNLIKDDHHATIINGCTFTQYEGFTGNGTDTGLEIDFNCSIDGVNFTLNNHGISSYVRTDRTADPETDVYCSMGALASADSNFRSIALLVWTYSANFNDTRHFGSTMGAIYEQISAFLPVTSRGLHQVSRTSSSASAYHVNGVERATSSAMPEAFPDANMGILFSKLFNGGREHYSTDQVAISAIRRGFNTTDAAAETAAFKACMTTLGTDVLP